MKVVDQAGPSAGDGIVMIEGDVTIATAADVLRSFEGIFGRSANRFVFDLSGVADCDSAALAVLLEWQRQAARQGKSVEFSNVPLRLRQLAQISELDDVMAFQSPD